MRAFTLTFLAALIINVFLMSFLLVVMPSYPRKPENSPKKFVNDIDRSGIFVPKSDFYITRNSGVAWGDYNQDNHLDLLIPRGAISLYMNNGNGTFTNVTEAAKLSGYKSTSGLFVDYNNDGCKDLFLNLESTLLRNNCKGEFENESPKSGIKKQTSSTGAAWADYNLDGYIDLYTTTYGDFGPFDNYLSNQTNPIYRYEPNALYQNNGDGTFRNVTKKARISGLAKCDIPDPTIGYYKLINGPFKESYQPIWFDYNNDGKPDLFIATDAGISPLYRNNGDGTFEDVTRQAGLCRRGSGMGVTVGDYNNDGNLDLYVTNNGPNYLWQNKGDGTFTETAAQLKVADHNELGWGSEFIDFDNDGLLDLYVANGSAYDLRGKNSKGTQQDKLFKNDGNDQFTDISQKEGFEGGFNKEPLAIADYDNNGFSDIFVVSGRHEAKSRFNLYRNNGNSNNWLTIKLIGTLSNKDAVGARISVTIKNLTQTKEVVIGSSFLSQSSIWQTFGLGTLKKADAVMINWPSGKKQIINNIDSNQIITLVEQ